MCKKIAIIGYPDQISFRKLIEKKIKEGTLEIKVECNYPEPKLLVPKS